MDRYDFFFRQKATEQELDQAFDAVEAGIQAFIAAFEFTGVATNGQVTEQAAPNFTVQVQGPAVIFDKQAQHISFAATQNVDCALDEHGAATAVVGAANSKYLSIFAHFERLLTDPRTDGFGDTIYYDRTESFSLRVVQGAEAVSPARPPLDATDILLADVLITFGQLTILNADIKVDRTEYIYQLTGSPTEINERSLHDVLQAMLDAVNTGVADLSDDTAPDDGATLVGIDAITGTNYSSPQGTLKAMLVDLLGRLDADTGSDGASAIGGASIAAGGSGALDLPAGTVRSQISAVVQALADQAIAGDDGANRIGMDVLSVGGFSLSQGSVRSAISDLLTLLNDQAGAGADGASRVGADVQGWLTQGDVGSQLNELQAGAMRRLASNDAFLGGFQGPLVDAGAAGPAPYLYELFTAGGGAQRVGIFAHVVDGALVIGQNLQIQGGETFEFAATGAARAVVFPGTGDASDNALIMKYWNIQTGGTSIGRLDSVHTGTQGGDRQVRIQNTVAAALFEINPNGNRITDAVNMSHKVGAAQLAAGSGEEMVQGVTFISKFNSVPSTLTYSPSASNLNAAFLDVMDVSVGGCLVRGTSSGAGAARMAGTLTVSL